MLYTIWLSASTINVTYVAQSPPLVQIHSIVRSGATDTNSACQCSAEARLKIASRTVHSTLSNFSATDLGLETTG